jgi:hypothetical protein
MTNGQDDPIQLDKIAMVFGDRVVERIMRRSGMILGTGQQRYNAMERVGEAIRVIMREYAVEVRRLTPNAMRREIAALAGAVDHPNFMLPHGDTDGSTDSVVRRHARIRDAWTSLSDDARQMLERRAQHIRQVAECRTGSAAHHRARSGPFQQQFRGMELPVVTLPAVEEFDHRERRLAASNAIFQLVVAGRGIGLNPGSSEGKAEPALVDDVATLTTKQRNRLRKQQNRLRLNAPSASRREPRRAAERQLVERLSWVWAMTTDEMPALTAQHFHPGLFARFVAELSHLARVPIKATSCDHDRRGLAVELITEIDRVRRKRRECEKLRRILRPLAVKYPLVSEIGRLVENGDALVLHIPAGAEAAATRPRKAALIEFGSGTLCIYAPSKGWRTLAIKRYPRARIMHIADKLHRKNARKRRAPERRRRLRLAGP